MRTAAVLLLLGLLLSGCQTRIDPPETSSTTTTTTSSSTSSTTAAPTPHEFPAGWTEAPPKSGFPGLRLAGEVTQAEGSFRLQARAANDGPNTYKVSSICTSPWQEAMQRDGQDVAHRQPTATCLAFGLAPFPAGSTVDATIPWNGTLWDDEDQRFRPAPSGNYTWSIGFQAYRGGSDEDTEFDDAATLWLDLAVRIA